MVERAGQVNIAGEYISPTDSYDWNVRVRFSLWRYSSNKTMVYDRDDATTKVYPDLDTALVAIRMKLS